uniref:C2H2-type domain-containing protein n=1 Tax=Plectus sambesii TaxID=2011161 RepID=A0A914W1U1_9BILA
MDQFGHQLGELKRLFRTLPPCDQNFALAMLSDSLNDMNVTVMLRQRLVDNSHRTMAAEAEFLIQERYGLPSPWPSTSHDDPMMLESFPDSAGGDHNDLINALFEGLPCSSDLPIEITDDAAQRKLDSDCDSFASTPLPSTSAGDEHVLEEEAHSSLMTEVNAESAITHRSSASDKRRSRIFSCPECHLNFWSKRRRNCHRKVHYSDRFVCCLCAKVLANRFRYERHLALRHNRGCHIRSKSPIPRPQLRPRGDSSVHRRDYPDCSVNGTVSGNFERLQCPKCDFIAANRKQLWRHKTKFGHEVDKRRDSLLHCLQCDYTTKFRQNLARHRIRLHASKAPINCEYCGKDFKDKDAVKTHIKYVHENERSYKCAECDKSFVTATNRSRHLRLTHQNSRVYCCTTCSKNFQTAYHLKRHLAMVCNRLIVNSKDKLISSVAAGRQ